jgi:hypothetical protein
MEASPVMGPEQIAFQRSPNVRHAFKFSRATRVRAKRFAGFCVLNGKSGFINGDFVNLNHPYTNMPGKITAIYQWHD